MSVPAPRFSRTHPDCIIECEVALDLPVQELIDQAAQSGWDMRTVIEAIEKVAREKALVYEEDPDPEDDSSDIDPSTPEFGTFPVE